MVGDFSKVAENSILATHYSELLLTFGAVISPPSADDHAFDRAAANRADLCQIMGDIEMLVRRPHRAVRVVICHHTGAAVFNPGDQYILNCGE